MEIMMADNKPKDPGTDQSQANRQSAEPGQEVQGSNAGHYTGFLNVPPESNVFPTGAPQSDRGAAESVHGGAAGGKPGAKDAGAPAQRSKGSTGGSYIADVNVNSADSDMKGSGSNDDDR
jgi:hypothetical protein